tara:strand:- start:1274 stop:1906 length:633 start_codon:yes stop_codon:yes gene_type:complete
MRARWSLIYSKKQVEWREVELKNKPKELMQVSPKGTVPVLITHNGHIIDESIEIIKWALRGNDKYDLMRLKNPKEKCLVEKLINENDFIFKNHLDKYKYQNRFQDDKAEIHKIYAERILKRWDNLLKTNEVKYSSNKVFLTGKRESIADWCLWPFVRQYFNYEKNFSDIGLELITLNYWLSRYINHPFYELLMKKSKPWSCNNKLKTFPH